MTRPSRALIEDFLYHEATLIDEWRLSEWLECFDDDGRYVIPALDCDPEMALEGDPRAMLCLVADDMHLIRARIDRLDNSRAHAEHPRSRIRHLVTNVRAAWTSSDRVEVFSNVEVHWVHHDKEGTYVAKCRHQLRWAGEEGIPQAFKISERRVIIDADRVGALSFIM